MSQSNGVATKSRIDWDEIESKIGEITTHISSDGAVGIPRTKSITYDFSYLKKGESGYGAYRHPAWTILEQVVSYTEGGDKAILRNEGRSAIDLVVKLLPVNSHIIVSPDDMYLGTRALLDEHLSFETGLQVTYVSSPTVEAFERARRPNTRMLLTECLTNPLLKVTDLSEIVRFAKANNIISVADNATTPLLVKPLEHGFDISAQCLTKYFSGDTHFGGALIFNKDRDDLHATLLKRRNRGGGNMYAGVAADIAETSRSLPARLQKHCHNTRLVAEFLKTQPLVERVYYPGLSDDPGHSLAVKQFADFGGLVSFDLKGGADAARRLIKGARESGKNVFQADSFADSGATFLNHYYDQSLILQTMPEAECIQKFGIRPGFIRVAVGLGSADRIKEGLARGFEAINSSNRTIVSFAGGSPTPLAAEARR